MNLERNGATRLRGPAVSWSGEGGRDVSMVMKNRSQHDLEQQLNNISRERAFALKTCEHNQLKLTKDLVEIDKYYCRRDCFDPLQFSFWTEEDLERERKREQRARRRKFNRPKTTPAALGARGDGGSCLYGEDISVVIRRTTPRAPSIPSRSATPFSDTSEVLSQKELIMEQIRKIKEEACSRRAVAKPKVIISNDFVHEFEWLDYKHSRWFMEKTTRKFHGKFIEFLEKLPQDKEPLYFTQNQIFRKSKSRRSFPHTA